MNLGAFVSLCFFSLQSLDRAGPLGGLCACMSPRSQMFLCVQLCASPHKNVSMCILMCVISGQRAQEEEKVWNVLQGSGMSVALDPWRLLVDEPVDGEEKTSPFSATPIRKAHRGVEFCKHACVGVQL